MTAPAVQIGYAEYDQIADALIATAGDKTAASRLRRMKAKGSVLPDGDRSVYVMGRI